MFKHLYAKDRWKREYPSCQFPYYHVCSKGTCKFLFDMRDYFDMDQYKKNQGEVKCPKCGFPRTLRDL